MSNYATMGLAEHAKALYEGCKAMKIEYTRGPLSMLVNMPLESVATIPPGMGGITHLWCWYPLVPRRPQTKESLDELIAQGYKRAEEAEHPFIASQLYDLCLVLPPAKEMPQYWYRPGEQAYPPVVLCYSLPDTPQHDQATIYMADYLPPPELGEYALVRHGQGRAQAYKVTDLKGVAGQRWTDMGERLRRLSAPVIWPPPGVDPLAYLEGQAESVRDLQETLRQDWETQWKTIQARAQELAVSYWELYKSDAARGTRPHSLSTLTSTQTTMFPSSNGVRGLVQSFGPGVQPDLWNNETGLELRLFTPNRSLIKVRGDGEHEHKVLHRYIMEEM